MPAVVALPAFWGAVTATAGAGGALVAGKLQSNASRDAANAQVSAANHAADLQSKSAADALAFQQKQAAQDQQNYVNTQLANYAQETARQQRIGQLGQMVGLGPRNIPPPPSYLTSQQTAPNASFVMPGGAPAPVAGASSVPSVNASNGDIGQQISSYFKARGVSDQETPYWVQKWQEFGAKDPAYFNTRLAQADVFRGGAPAGAARNASAMPPAVMPMNALFSPSRAPLTPALTLPQANPFGVNA